MFIVTDIMCDVVAVETMASHCIRTYLSLFEDRWSNHYREQLSCFCLNRRNSALLFKWFLFYNTAYVCTPKTCTAILLQFFRFMTVSQLFLHSLG